LVSRAGVVNHRSSIGTVGYNNILHFRIMPLAFGNYLLARKDTDGSSISALARKYLMAYALGMWLASAIWFHKFMMARIKPLALKQIAYGSQMGNGFCICICNLARNFFVALAVLLWLAFIA